MPYQWLAYEQATQKYFMTADNGMFGPAGRCFICCEDICTPGCSQKTFFCKGCKQHLAHQSCFVDYIKSQMTRAPHVFYATDQDTAEHTIPFGKCPMCNTQVFREELLQRQRNPQSWPLGVQLLSAQTVASSWMREQIPELKQALDVGAGFILICTGDIARAQKEI